jgi:hypothetical protein
MGIDKHPRHAGLLALPVLALALAAEMDFASPPASACKSHPTRMLGLGATRRAPAICRDFSNREDFSKNDDCTADI